MKSNVAQSTSAEFLRNLNTANDMDGGTFDEMKTYIISL